jgi:DNA mismatch endonuclease (patch repair protein)
MTSAPDDPQTVVTNKAREPKRDRPDQKTSSRYSRQKRSGTAPELLLRRELHRRGRRFRVQMRIPGLPRRRVDLAFTRWRLVVYMEGCFWHGCPVHGVLPGTNRDWWTWKLARNSDRDHDTDDRLRSLGWHVLRVWEHVSPGDAADEVEASLVRLGAPGTSGRARGGPDDLVSS